MTLTDMETMIWQILKMEPLIREEARSSGLDKAKDKNGIDMYPNISAMVITMQILTNQKV